MDQERQRRFFAILFLCFLYVATSFLQSMILGKVETTSSGILKSATDYAFKTSNKIKSYSEEVKDKEEAKGDTGERDDKSDEEDDTNQLSSKPFISLKS
ncbi:UNVERIFIED_CONTAM: hypothetical protein RMT77_011948 [Armadillidium vulgare]